MAAGPREYQPDATPLNEPYGHVPRPTPAPSHARCGGACGAGSGGVVGGLPTVPNAELRAKTADARIPDIR